MSMAYMSEFMDELKKSKYYNKVTGCIEYLKDEKANKYNVGDYVYVIQSKCVYIEEYEQFININFAKKRFKIKEVDSNLLGGRNKNVFYSFYDLSTDDIWISEKNVFDNELEVLKVCNDRNIKQLSRLVN